ncbi:hypothetical protein DFP72DRAFT_1017083 [Ephemerocybe angulata]|uniref:BTB domain-containing protein n=1 Tax=Ephemerocybe angulata TaxID=980116 RepID=A0A8H6LWR6_9AGAR|nr:hypothetical protein DFP72DRAFT_1017083 [Tulosesus angulatus]
MTTEASDMTRTSSPPHCVIDEDYYWDLVKFSAEDHIFRVPKHRFMTDSETFATTYGLDRAHGSEDEFTAEDPFLNAVNLDVTAHEFRTFLKAIYPKQLQGELTLTTSEWLAVLKLSTKWLFNGFRKMAIEKLSFLTGMDPVEKVRIGKEFCVEAWLLSGYRELVNRSASITVDEAGNLGWQSAIRLCALREDWKIPGRREPVAKTFPANLVNEIEIAFQDKFGAIREAQSLYMTSEERAEVERKRQIAEREAKEAAETKAREEHIAAQRLLDLQRMEEEQKLNQMLDQELGRRLDEIDAISLMQNDAVTRHDEPPTGPCTPLAENRQEGVEVSICRPKNLTPNQRRKKEERERRVYERQLREEMDRRVRAEAAQREQGMERA